MNEYIVYIAPDNNNEGIRIQANNFEDAFLKTVGNYHYREVNKDFPLPDVIVEKDGIKNIMLYFGDKNY